MPSPKGSSCRLRIGRWGRAFEAVPGGLVLDGVDQRDFGLDLGKVGFKAVVLDRFDGVQEDESSPSGHLQLRFRPAHNRNRAYAVLWAAFDDPVAVGHINQDVALLVEEAHDLKRLE
jgi:hypothetical protein